MDDLKKHLNTNPSVIATWIILSIFVLSIAAAGYFFMQNKNLQKKLSNEKIIVANELDTILEKVNKLIDLPTDERPELATIADKELITNQPFFAKAQEGDKVLVYKIAKIAYLYRPSTNKIVNVGPVTIATPTVSTPVSVSPSISDSPTITQTARATPTSTPTPTPTTPQN